MCDMRISINIPFNVNTVRYEMMDFIHFLVKKTKITIFTKNSLLNVKSNECDKIISKGFNCNNVS